jgi:L-ascorbate metabolism protein UlaG (beta-lactamase superfamily)
MDKRQPLRTAPITKQAFEQIDYTLFYWLAAGGILLNVHGQIIFIDPTLKMNHETKTCETGLKMKLPYPIDSVDVPKVNHVFYTHSDDEHMGELTARDLASKKAIMWGPPPVFYKLMKYSVPFAQSRMCRAGDKEILDNITVEVIPADHPWQLMNPEKYGKPFRAEDCVGYIINTPDGRFLFPGDTRLMEEHLAIDNIQVLALDVSIDKYHLGPEGAILLANSLPEALIVPIHYGTYEPTMPGYIDKLEEVIPEINNSIKRMRTLSPGQPLRIKNVLEI